ncbi:MAG: adenylate/guanylate cyclase domain-containing protein [Deltaproteobacteria bacterium]|nr:MAG: adenylate/guanylate cyclase domain-containing protein [Deltaproteobacteria bacterium]
MEPQNIQRKLTAILSADVKGYSRLMGEDEVSTVLTITAYRKVMATLIQKHRGRVVDSPGDNLLAEFSSVVDAVRCAVEIQEEFKARNAELPENRKMEFRIGVNLGDVIVEGERIYGDGVNIAARVEGLAEGGGICISRTVYDHIENKLALRFEYLGEQAVKNIAKPVRVYRVLMEPGVAAGVSREKRARPRRWQWAALAVAAVLLVGVVALAIWNFYLRPAAPPTLVPSEKIPAIELPDKPSIAVLPFANMSGDPEQEYFSDGITDDLITDLSKISGLFVIARNSVFAYKGKTAKMERVSRELGIRYVLQGSVRKAGDRIRITAQLVDVNTGGHLWAEKYDRDLKDIFALQDEVTQKIVTALAVRLTKDEQERLVRKGTDNVEAYDYTLRGGEYFFRFTKGANAQAQQMFETAINLDPEYASAHSWLGWTHWIEWSFGWSQDPQSLERAFELAQMAIALDDSLPDAHRLLGSVYLWKKRHEQAIAVFEKSIALNPNHADAIRGLGETLYFAGKPEEAIRLIKRGMRLNPIYPVWYLLNLGHAYFLTGRYEESIAALKRALVRNPHVWPAHVYLAASYIALGKEKKARAEAAEIVRINPNFSLETMRQRLPYKDQAVLERLFDSLRKAGLK